MREVDDQCDLRFGTICSLFYRDILGMRSVPKQIDLLDEFFPGLAVWEVDSNGSLVLRDDHAVSDPFAYMESLPPEQIDRPTSPEHMELYETLMERSKENHSWWAANTAEFQTSESLPAFYDDRRRAILAMRQDNGKFLLNIPGASASQQSRRVTQLLGRLTGTAKGSPEKERAAASAMQKRMASDLCHNQEAILFYRNHIAQLIYDLDEDQLDRFCELVPEYMNEVIDRRERQTVAEREGEPFPIDDDIYE